MSASVTAPCLDLTAITDRVLTTTGHDPGATLVAHPAAHGTRWTLIDAADTPEAVAERLHQASLQGRAASSLVLMHTTPGHQWQEWQEWIPEHVSTLRPAQTSPGGTPLPCVPRARAYRTGPDQAIVALEQSIVLAGDLMAPHLPDLSRTSPRSALEGLMYAAACAPMVLVGSQAHVLSARTQVAADGPVPTEHLATVADIRMRQAYLREIIAIAQHAVREDHSPWQAAYQSQGTLARWGRTRAYNQRHLVNIHVALAAERGHEVDLPTARDEAATL